MRHSDGFPDERPVSPGDPGEEKKSNSGCLLGCLGMFVAVVGLSVSCGFMMGDGDDDWTPTTTEARLICEDWVRDKLKAPATAEFTDGSESGASGDYTITGSVDAQNSFGALVRNDWTCSIAYDESSEEWRGNVRLADS